MTVVYTCCKRVSTQNPFHKQNFLIKVFSDHMQHYVFPGYAFQTTVNSTLIHLLNDIFFLPLMEKIPVMELVVQSNV